MSGPILEPDRDCEDEPVPAIEVREGRTASVGGLDIVRVLPTKGRRTVGAWCFVDLMLPSDEPDPMEVGPHPHIGLSTVTWLLEGEALHSDSLGTQQPIRPGQLNLMTAGRGIAHAELGTTQRLHGVQMWLAQPEATRHGMNRFEHRSELPAAELSTGMVKVFVGSLAGVTSPVATETALVGAQADLRPGTVELSIESGFEHCVVPIDHPTLVDDVVVEPGWIALVPAGREAVRIHPGDSGGRIMFLGGEPMGERIQMWWNFVGRSRDELTRAYLDWKGGDEDRFGPVPTALERIEAPVPPWLG